MASRRPRAVHVYLDAEPPADVLAAARRGECIVVRVVNPAPPQRWGEALARWADATRPPGTTGDATIDSPAGAVTALADT